MRVFLKENLLRLLRKAIIEQNAFWQHDCVQRGQPIRPGCEMLLCHPQPPQPIMTTFMLSSEVFTFYDIGTE